MTLGKKLLNDMYKLYECMLGQNMIRQLPEDKQKEYLELTSDLSKLDYEKIQGFFDPIANHDQIMKETLRQFSEIYMKNAEFNAEDYPVPLESCGI